ncbi:MAG: MgtC/SapB family protein [Candidatus Paceibacterota bacterium]|jgi:putative Mg2+ transporter-C (MgtC) family protein
MITLTLTEIIIRISVAVGLGALLGLERTLAGKSAGLRTYAMVSLGSALFILIAELVSLSVPNSNPLLLGSAIITGIGFIGAGLVLFQDHKVTGLTTAAGLWVSAGIGMASGYGLYQVATVAFIAALLVFTFFWFIESILKKLSYNRD